MPKPSNPTLFKPADILRDSMTGNKSYHPAVCNLTLRDLFAAAALVVIGEHITGPSLPNRQRTTAKLTYDMADAMLKAREGGQDAEDA